MRLRPGDENAHAPVAALGIEHRRPRDVGIDVERRPSARACARSIRASVCTDRPKFFGPITLWCEIRTGTSASRPICSVSSIEASDAVGLVAHVGGVDAGAAAHHLGQRDDFAGRRGAAGRIIKPGAEAGRARLERVRRARCLHRPRSRHRSAGRSRSSIAPSRKVEWPTRQTALTAGGSPFQLGEDSPSKVRKTKPLPVAERDANVDGMSPSMTAARG